MNAVKHTPGPWNVDPSHPTDVQAAGCELAAAFQRRDLGAEWRIRGPITADFNTACANARLIAESPAMLALLKDLVDMEGPMPGTSAWGDKVLALIARIEGEEA